LEKTTNWRDEKWLNTILPLIRNFALSFLKGVKDEGMTKLLESVLNQVLQAQAIMIPKIKTDKTAQIS